MSVSRLSINKPIFSNWGNGFLFMVTIPKFKRGTISLHQNTGLSQGIVPLCRYFYCRQVKPASAVYSRIDDPGTQIGQAGIYFWKILLLYIVGKGTDRIFLERETSAHQMSLTPSRSHTRPGGTLWNTLRDHHQRFALDAEGKGPGPEPNDLWVPLG